MKKSLLLVLLLMPSVVFSQDDETAVKQVVTSAYIEGIHNRGSSAAIRKGFHPTFIMLRLINNEVKPLPIEEWISNIEKSRKEEAAAPPKAEGKFIFVDITGNNAVVKLELFRENKKIFTDYLMLYKFTEGWKIVSKTFYRHP